MHAQTLQRKKLLPLMVSLVGIWIARAAIPFVLFAMVGCNSEEVRLEEPADNADVTVPEHLSHLENLTVYSLDGQPPDTVLITRETYYESTEDVYMAGYVSTFTVDEEERVYVVSSIPGNVGVYVFNPDGSYVTTIGSAGRGPGEFESISAIHVWGRNLTVFAPRLQKIATYSIDDYEKTDEQLIVLDEVRESENLAANLRGNDLFVMDNGDKILSTHMTTLMEDSDNRRILYYSLADDGIATPGSLLELQRYKSYFLPEREGFSLPVILPFVRSSLVAISPEGDIYTAWTDEFLIKKYDQEGNYVQSFYYPFENSPLLLDEIELSDNRERITREHEMPDTWPALHTMELDDEGRLWVATITDREDAYTWWVLSSEGELLARFEQPGNRNFRSVMSQPEIVINNGYLYTREVDVREEINRVVKHRIEFQPNHNTEKGVQDEG